MPDPAAPGPRAMLRPAFPNSPAWVTGFKRRKEDLLSHSFTVCGPALGLPMRSGRLAKYADSGGLLACRATLALSYTVKGVPEFADAIRLTCQPRKRVLAAPVNRLPKGSCQLPLATKR